MQDEDYNEAEAGSRVGLSIKGVTDPDEMKRGSVLCAPGEAKSATKLNLSFTKSFYYSDEIKKGVFHATIGMQTIPITITEENSSSIGITCEKSFAYTPKDTFLLLDLNAKKTRIMGKARPL